MKRLVEGRWVAVACVRAIDQSGQELRITT